MTRKEFTSYTITPDETVVIHNLHYNNKDYTFEYIVSTNDYPGDVVETPLYYVVLKNSPRSDWSHLGGVLKEDLVNRIREISIFAAKRDQELEKLFTIPGEDGRIKIEADPEDLKPSYIQINLPESETATKVFEALKGLII